MGNKFLIIVAILLLSCSVQAVELVIPAGETYIVTEAQRELRLKKWVMGDKAVIKFAPGVTYWDVTAEHVEIGRDVTIDGRGADGLVATSAATLADRAGECKKGQRGNPGAEGVRGGNGVDMELRLHIIKLGSLVITADGGNGGVGGNGGKGQKGGLTGNCDPTAGGEGGLGGKGAEGGNGGKVMVSLSSAGGEGLLALSHRIEARADAGKGAVGGKGGEGGEGSEGKYINQKTLTGDKKWVSGGKTGEIGPEGEKGRDGQSGRVFIGGGDLLVASKPADKKATVASLPASAKDELSVMAERIDALEKRLEALEKR
jgi:hypothetical protein